MKELAHPKALILLKEDFFWDRSDEFAPFGSDEGSDGFLHFYNWKQENPTKEAIQYIKEYVLNFQIDFHYKDLNHVDTQLINECYRYIITDEIDF